MKVGGLGSVMVSKTLIDILPVTDFPLGGGSVTFSSTSSLAGPVNGS